MPLSLPPDLWHDHTAEHAIATGAAPAPRQPRGPFWRWLGRTILRVFAWMIGGVILLVLIAYLLHADSTPAEVVHDRVMRQVRLVTLEPGEEVRLTVDAYHRSPWDYFQKTRGVLVLTDRRVVFVGAPPREILAPRDEPQPFVQRPFPLDTTTAIHFGSVYLGTATGIALRHRQRTQIVAVAPEHRELLRGIADTMRLRAAATRELARMRREAELAAQAAARAPRFHIVTQGEALSTIATRFNTTPEQLMAWNGLPSPRIRVGQRLMVKPQT